MIVEIRESRSLPVPELSSPRVWRPGPGISALCGHGPFGHMADPAVDLTRCSMSADHKENGDRRRRDDREKVRPRTRKSSVACKPTGCCSQAATRDGSGDAERGSPRDRGTSDGKRANQRRIVHRTDPEHLDARTDGGIGCDLALGEKMADRAIVSGRSVLVAVARQSLMLRRKASVAVPLPWKGVQPRSAHGDRTVNSQDRSKYEVFCVRAFQRRGSEEAPEEQALRGYWPTRFPMLVFSLSRLSRPCQTIFS